MPSKTFKKADPRFRMDTAAFVTIWRNHLAHPVADSWKTFVVNCFDRFAEDESNLPALKHHGFLSKPYQDDKKYEFLSERCYAKCSTIKSKLKKDEDYDVDLPDGYLERGGRSQDKSNHFEGHQGNIRRPLACRVNIF